MIDRETVKKRLRDLRRYIEDREWSDNREDRQAVTDYWQAVTDALTLLKEQDELLHKKQKDVDRLCNEISEWKHKFHDRPLKEQEAVEPFHRCIGKDFILIEDSHFDYCPYCGKPITWAKQEGR